MQTILAAKAKDGKWLPLSQHLDDTAGVMEHLLEGFIAPSVYVAAGFENDKDKFKRIALFAAATHDIGKATSAFQIKMCDALPGYRERIEEDDFIAKTTGMESESPHALAGASILEHCFQINPSICEIVASHHGKPPMPGVKARDQMAVFEGNYCRESYEGVWKQIVENAKSYADVDGISCFSVNAQMILTGLLIMADWIASCEEFFPLFDAYEYAADPDRVSKGIKAFKLHPYHDFKLAGMDTDSFKERFGFEPNMMQQEILRISNNISCPGIMIIEVPMGLGKTEAALAAAETESHKAGTGGIFFGLPTRATANAMFVRVEDWCERLELTRPASIGLVHSSAEFNDSYRELCARTFDEDKAGLSVNSWMSQKYRKLLPDFTVGTVDQFLFGALKKKFLMLLHLGLSGKTVIIDEVHAYDDYMSEYMRSMLSWLGAYKVPVILLSATLTKEKRLELVGAYLGDPHFKKADYSELDSFAYPAITWTDGNHIHLKALDPNLVPNKTINIKTMDKADLTKVTTGLLSEGGCAGAICDTVTHAQKTYWQLKSLLPSGYTVILLHSRFLPKDRAEIEDRIVSLVGKGGKERDKIVVIGTQVLEQSLDLDFDVMFTEKCPIDFFFQRLGRLHRHERKYRPDKVKEPVCYIFDDSWSSAGARIYDSYIIRRTDEVLAGRHSITIPCDIRPLTEDVYDLSKGSDGKDKDAYKDSKARMRDKAGRYLLPMAHKCHFKGMLNEANEGEGAVRQDLNNVEVIILKRANKGYETYSGVFISNERIPDEEEVMELLSNKLSLRKDDDLEECLSEEAKMDSLNGIKLWKKNSFLESEHFLIADEDGLFMMGGHFYQYTKEAGWEKVKK